ncbi:MAG: hypothetical protein ACREBE_20455 [bacterium]
MRSAYHRDVMLSLALFVWAALQAPSLPTEPPTSQRDAAYGDPEPVDLWDLTAGVRTRHAVRTKGVLGVLEQGRGKSYYELRERGGRVVILVVGELDGSIGSLVGRRVEVVGFVRPLVESQGTCTLPPNRRVVPQSYCDDPELPTTPDLGPDRIGWPRISVTIWSITDITALQHGAEAADLTAALDAPAGEKVSVRGKFAGANLDKDLQTAAPEPRAWVLRSGDQAIWVIGKEPRGKGWSFDPAYRGDLGKWLVVEGRMAPCGTARCLRASRVSLAGTPKAKDVE